MASVGTHDFTHTDFPCPSGRTGRSQVHEIDAGNEQNKRCDDGKNGYVLNVSRRMSKSEKSMKMDIL
jgi:hypothetical protein